ncbi:MAG: hypothetical protein WC974_09670 [Thermoplasmata archaeon]
MSGFQDVNGLASAIPYVGGLSALLSIGGGILGSQSSPQEDYFKNMSKTISDYMPYLSSSAFSKSDIDNIVKSISAMYRGSANVAAGGIGASLGESLNASGVPKGQPSASMYVSELAPVIAEGEKGAASAAQWGSDFFANLDAQAKQRVMSALGMMSSLGQGYSDQTGGQKGLMSGISSFNMLTSGFGNIAKMWKDINTQEIKVD